jgi:CheY-like chemotaxis protein
VRPTNPSARPSNVRDAMTEAHALGGGAVARPSAMAQAPGKKTVMLVDADPSLRARLRALLQEHYDVVEASDGLEAVELMNKIQQPAMVVCDTAMPRLDGFSFAKMLRANPMMKRVPIMFVSAQHSAQHVTQALVIGVSQYLPKTTPLAQIVEKIRKIAL